MAADLSENSESLAALLIINKMNTQHFTVFMRLKTKGSNNPLHLKMGKRFKETLNVSQIKIKIHLFYNTVAKLSSSK